MSYITAINRVEPESHRSFVAARLLGLKQRLRQKIFSVSDERSLRLATWNLMHFGDGGAYRRTTESLMYIAEIIDHFDLVAIQEINENLDDFHTLMKRHLGGDWDYIVTDTTEGGPGNHERLAFAFRRSKVWFQKEAGEVVLPEGQKIVGPEGAKAEGREIQFARTPFNVAFQSGWFKFKLCTVHIYYGKAQGAELEQRRREIHRIAKFLAQRQEHEQKVRQEEANYILLGDFNIISPEHETMKALEDVGFKVPQAIKEAPSNLSGNRHYDQIAFKLADERCEFGNAGVFDMFSEVYRTQDSAQYIDVVKPESFEENSRGEPRNREQKANYYKQYYRRHQMSDHKLLWCELKTDFSDDYLEEVIGENGN